MPAPKSKTARQLWILRRVAAYPKVVVICPRCGAVSLKRKGARFCSDQCARNHQVRRWRKRHPRRYLRLNRKHRRTYTRRHEGASR